MTGVYRSTEDPNKITIIADAPSVESAQAFFSNPELKSTMERVGVISIPEIKLLNKV